MGIFTIQRYTLHFICIFISCSLYAQTDFGSYRLDTFKLPDIHLTSLTVFGSVYGRHTDTDRPGGNFEINDQSWFSPNIDLSYNRYVNTPRLQSSSFLNLDQSFDIRRVEGITGISKTTDLNTSISTSSSNRYYTGKRFFQLSGSASFNYSYDRQEFTDSLETDIDKDKSYSIRLEPVIGIGNGRLEPVSDVAMALFILQDAADLGVDLAAVTTEDIYAFASLMAEVRNRRILDFRRMRIAELRDLYAHMLTNGWVLPDDPGFFTVLTDNWTYTNVFFRQAGKRWTYSLSPRYFYLKNIFSPLSGSERQEIGAGITIDYQKHQPVNLYRDNRRSHTLSLNYGHAENGSLIYGPLGDYAQLKFDNSIGRSWYPNNRTNISGSINLGYRYYRFFEPRFFTPEDQHVINAGAGLQAFYFLSYRTQLNLNALVQYGFSSGGALVEIINGFSATPEITGFHATLNARIVVALF